MFRFLFWKCVQLTAYLVRQYSFFIFKHSIILKKCNVINWGSLLFCLLFLFNLYSFHLIYWWKPQVYMCVYIYIYIYIYIWSVYIQKQITPFCFIVYCYHFFFVIFNRVKITQLQFDWDDLECTMNTLCVCVCVCVCVLVVPLLNLLDYKKIFKGWGV